MRQRASSVNLRTAPLVAAALVALAAACGEPGREAQLARTEPVGRTPRDARPSSPLGLDGATTGADASAGTSAPTPTPASAPTGDDEELDSGDAIPVWQAVVDRDRYLARRGQRAVIAGRMGGEAIAPGARGVVRWLVDETEGHGALAIRAAIVGNVPPEGARVAVTGAWAVDDQRRWYWQVSALDALETPAPTPPPEAPAAPGLVIGTGPPPPGHRPISKATGAGVVTFGVVQAPRGDGDAWLIADNSFATPVAYLFLPGERASYGGHDMRQPDERWQLARNVLYWVRIDRVRRRTPEDMARVKAVTAPVKWY